MNEADPFRHHPGLRGKIKSHEDSFFRDISAEKIRATLKANGLPEFSMHSEDEREANRQQTLANRPDGPLWIFAYGSLMWDPALKFAEVRRAELLGYERRFILIDTLGGRGTADQPGVMAALDHGDHCNGLIFRIEDDLVTQETRILWNREYIRPAYHPTFLPVSTAAGQVHALTFVADHDADMILPDMSAEAQLEYLATGTGFLGSSADYLRGIVENFQTLGIEDATAEQLLTRVEARIAALAAPSGSTASD